MDESGQEILDYLGDHPRKVSLGQIAYRIGRDRATVYRQLRKMREAGLVQCTRENQGSCYQIEVLNV